jgi:hypothetical protein
LTNAQVYKLELLHAAEYEKCKIVRASFKQVARDENCNNVKASVATSCMV